MVTVINNPPGGNAGNETGGGMGMILGVILVVIVLALFFVFGRSALNSTGGGGETPTNQTGGNSGPTLNVPDEIDVNVQQK